MVNEFARQEAEIKAVMISRGVNIDQAVKIWFAQQQEFYNKLENDPVFRAQYKEELQKVVG